MTAFITITDSIPNSEIFNRCRMFKNVCTHRCSKQSLLTQWGRLMYICVCKKVVTYSENDSVQGLVLLRQFPPFRYFPIFSVLSNHTLTIEYHVYIWQVSPQLCCGDTCQIRMWFEESNMYFCQKKKSKILLTEKLTNRAVVTPTPGSSAECHYIMQCGRGFSSTVGNKLHRNFIQYIIILIWEINLKHGL